MLETYLGQLDLCYFEVCEAFKGLADENVWKRPVPGLLSVGELAGHIAHWEALKFSGEGRDLATSKVRGPLVDERFAYYTSNVGLPPSAEHLAMTAEQVHKELVRVHEEAMASLKALNPDLDTAAPGWPPHWTYREFLKYAAFHIAYHTGQMYSVRHLLGEETPDN
jgi:hypothetical protein